MIWQSGIIQCIVWRLECLSDCVNVQTTGSVVFFFFFFKILIWSFTAIHNKCSISVISPIQWIFNQHCGHWRPGALAPGYHKPECCIHAHAFTVVYGLTHYVINCFEEILPLDSRGPVYPARLLMSCRSKEPSHQEPFILILFFSNIPTSATQVLTHCPFDILIEITHVDIFPTDKMVKTSNDMRWLMLWRI